MKGVPNIFVPKRPLLDSRFFDPLNTWYIYYNKPLKESLEKFAKFPISTSFENVNGDTIEKLTQDLDSDERYIFCIVSFLQDFSTDNSAALNAILS